MLEVRRVDGRPTRLVGDHARMSERWKWASVSRDPRLKRLTRGLVTLVVAVTAMGLFELLLH